MSNVLKAFSMMMDRKASTEANKDKIAANAVNLVYKQKQEKELLALNLQAKLFEKNMNKAEAVRSSIENELISNEGFRKAFNSINKEEDLSSSGQMAYDKSVSIENNYINLANQANADLQKFKTLRNNTIGIMNKVTDLKNDLAQVSYTEGEDKTSYDAGDFESVFVDWKEKNKIKDDDPSLGLYNNEFAIARSDANLATLNKKLSDAEKANLDAQIKGTKLSIETGLFIPPTEYHDHTDDYIGSIESNQNSIDATLEGIETKVIDLFKNSDGQAVNDYKNSAFYKSVEEGFRRVTNGSLFRPKIEGKKLKEEMSKLHKAGISGKEGGIDSKNYPFLSQQVIKDGPTFLELGLGPGLTNQLVKAEERRKRHHDKDLRKENIDKFYPDSIKGASDIRNLLYDHFNIQPQAEASPTTNEDLKSILVDIQNKDDEDLTIQENLMKHEGFEPEVYQLEIPDGKGGMKLDEPTAGFGHVLTEAERALYPVGTEVPAEVTMQWFQEDFKKHSNNAKKLADDLGIDINNYADTMGEALVNVSFQLGENWNIEKFPKAYQALKEGDLDLAIQEFQTNSVGDSTLWEDQTKNRFDAFIGNLEEYKALKDSGISVGDDGGEKDLVEKDVFGRIKNVSTEIEPEGLVNSFVVNELPKYNSFDEMGSKGFLPLQVERGPGSFSNTQDAVTERDVGVSNDLKLMRGTLESEAMNDLNNALGKNSIEDVVDLIANRRLDPSTGRNYVGGLSPLEKVLEDFINKNRGESSRSGFEKLLLGFERSAGNDDNAYKGRNKSDIIKELYTIHDDKDYKTTKKLIEALKPFLPNKETIVLGGE